MPGNTGNRITPQQWVHFDSLYAQGWSVSRAAVAAGMSSKTAWARLGRAKNGEEYRERRAEKTIPDAPIPLGEVCDAALEALDDRTGRLWARRYWGIELGRWQVYYWEGLEDGWASPDRQHLLVNAPPGAGKSTDLTIFASKLVAKHRESRGMFMSRAQSLAVRNVLRVRRALERVTPAVGAETTLSADFGRFKPKAGEVWKRDEFVVVQMDGSPIEEKEPTVSAFGFDSEWLGNRLNWLFGDDLDSTRSIRNFEIVEGNRTVFDNELEPRLDHGGLLALAQQRLGVWDFSAHVKAKVLLPDDDDGEDDHAGEAQYEVMAFRAHYEELCRGKETHRLDAPAWPDGCLLDPRNLPWRDVRKAMNRPDTFKVVYQQEDPGESDALVRPLWVDGGRDSEGHEFIGCWDKDRRAWEVPEGLAAPRFGVVTVDPSPSRYWSVQAWLIAFGSEQRYLLDIERKRMEAPDFLDWSVHLNDWTGLAEDWRKLYLAAGQKLTHLIVERNAAQRFILQYDHFHRWRSKYGVQVIAHDTARNKADEDFGVQMLGPRYRDGQVRLPGRGAEARLASMKLVDEVTRYPHSPTDDCVMAQWFLEHNLASLTRRLNNKPKMLWRPSWAPSGRIPA